MNTPKIVRVDIVDNDAPYNEQLLETFYLVDPDEKKLEEFKDLVEGRFADAEENKFNPFIDSYLSVAEYVNANFTTLDIERREIQW